MILGRRSPLERLDSLHNRRSTNYSSRRRCRFDSWDDGSSRSRGRNGSGFRDLLLRLGDESGRRRRRERFRSGGREEIGGRVESSCSAHSNMRASSYAVPRVQVLQTTSNLLDLAERLLSSSNFRPSRYFGDLARDVGTSERFALDRSSSRGRCVDQRR